MFLHRYENGISSNNADGYVTCLPSTGSRLGKYINANTNNFNLSKKYVIYEAHHLNNNCVYCASSYYLTINAHVLSCVAVNIHIRFYECNDSYSIALWKVRECSQ